MTPAFFLAHGSPVMVLESTEYTRKLKSIAQKIRKPDAILIISAHWLTNGTYVNTTSKPKTIHDFYGFPAPLYDIEYNCPGSPEFAELIRIMMTEYSIEEDEQRGLDHGAWQLLIKIYPKADIPVFQMSIDQTISTEKASEMGIALRFLRERNVLVIGSGNIVHNLSLLDWENRYREYEWSVGFEREVIENLEHVEKLHTLGKPKTIQNPTNEHFLPLLYILGLKKNQEKVQVLHKGIEYGGISMLSIQVGE